MAVTQEIEMVVKANLAKISPVHTRPHPSHRFGDLVLYALCIIPDYLEGDIEVRMSVADIHLFFWHGRTELRQHRYVLPYDQGPYVNESSVLERAVKRLVRDGEVHLQDGLVPWKQFLAPARPDAQRERLERQLPAVVCESIKRLVPVFQRSAGYVAQ